MKFSMSNTQSLKELNKNDIHNSDGRYLSLQDLERFFSVIGDREHKLMMKTIYELGCRVGEFVKIKLKHLDFENNAVFFPAENTKARQARRSYISKELMNELKEYLKREGRVTEISEILEPETFLFRSGFKNQPEDKGMTENRIRQIFSKYIEKASLQKVYGHDSIGRALHLYTVQSLRYSHIVHAQSHLMIKTSIVAKQVGHTSLLTSVYGEATEEMVKEAYEKARNR